MPTTFFRLLLDDDKATCLSDAIKSVQSIGTSRTAYTAQPSSFAKLPGSPVVYWVSERVLDSFTELPDFQSEGREIRAGLQTSDDFRFVRLWWEPKADSLLSGLLSTTRQDFLVSTYQGKRWAPFSKGGINSSFYADLHLVVNWADDGQEMKEWIVSNVSDPGTTVWSRNIRSVEYYFRSGISWSARPSTRGVFSIVPRGAVFSHTGPMVFCQPDQEWRIVAVLNSDAYIGLLHLLMPRGGSNTGQTLKYEVGYVASVPIPTIDISDASRLKTMATQSYDLTRQLATSDEICHEFLAPIALFASISSDSLRDCTAAWHTHVAKTSEAMLNLHRMADDIVFHAYSISKSDRRVLEEMLRNDVTVDSNVGNEDSVTESVDKQADPRAIATDVMSYILGCAFARWDIRIGRDPSLAPKLADPFAPLPICAPGALVSPDGLPATPGHIVSEEWLRARPDAITLPPAGSVQRPTLTDDQYPIRIAWDGILVDDPGHPADIVGRVREALAVLWPGEDGAQAEAIEREACKILGVRELRDYFRKPAGFFEDHLRRYSKSRRQAPIYWPLSTASGSFTLWIYYHRLTSDTLYSAVNRYVESKLDKVRRRLADDERALGGASGREASQLRASVEQQQAFLRELQDFRDELLRVAALPCQPDLNDGVIITAAPLHRLFRLPRWTRDTKACWEKLERGDYDWAHLAYTLWRDRVQEKCRTDKSIAIAHDLERLYVEPPAGMQQQKRRAARKVSGEPEGELVEEEGDE